MRGFPKGRVGRVVTALAGSPVSKSRNGVQMRKRKLSLLLVIVLPIFAAVAASRAAADAPTIVSRQFDNTSVVTDICAFPVTARFVGTFRSMRFFDENGTPTMWVGQTTEQDTFSANGKTLTGVPYKYETRILFDSSGNVTHNSSSGIVERVPLPDGRTVFLSAGRIDFMDHPDAQLVISADNGNPGDVAAFCAALAP